MISTIIDIETTNLLTGPGLSEPIDKTTGYLKDDREILEVSYIRVDNATAEILSSGSLYFYKDYFQIENEAQRFHGLTRDFLKQYKDDFDKNLIILDSLFQKTNIIGKNSEHFDIPFIRGFIDKHGKSKLNLDDLIIQAKIKKIDGDRLIYNPILFSTEIQSIFKSTFRRLYTEKTGQVLHPNKRGTLSEYIEVLDAFDKVDEIYASLPKDRVTKAHGALYDCVMTYVVWKECKDRELI